MDSLIARIRFNVLFGPLPEVFLHVQSVAQELCKWLEDYVSCAGMALQIAFEDWRTSLIGPLSGRHRARETFCYFNERRLNRFSIQNVSFFTKA